MSEKYLYNLLLKSWSKTTCFPSVQDKWNKFNPSLGQCAITSLVVNDIYGGKIMRCMCGDISHYYNIIDNRLVDLTVTQFEGKIPDYENGEERTKERLLANDDTAQRYKKLLSDIKQNLTDDWFKQIENDPRAQYIKRYFDDIVLFSTFEIDSYFCDHDFEYIEFDLAAQGTGNIFNYQHNLATDEYLLSSPPLIYTSLTTNLEVTREVLESIFDLARSNQEYFMVERAVTKSLNRS